MKIFLSPANHYKPYAIDGLNEKQQMDKLAPLLKEKLEEYIDVEVIITKIHSNRRDYTGRPYEAYGIDANIYIALHTNASGVKAKGGKATGASAFYHPAFRDSKNIAKCVVEELNKICPIKSNRAASPAIYPWNYTTGNFGELREPARFKIAPVIIEHEFHDREDGAKWISENLEAIAKADAQGIAKALNLIKKGDVNGDGEVNNLDATKILKYDAGIIDLNEKQLKAADINGDGAVNSADVSEILKREAGIK